jgi:protein-tyrosine phosphatase
MSIFSFPIDYYYRVLQFCKTEKTLDNAFDKQNKKSAFCNHVSINDNGGLILLGALPTQRWHNQNNQPKFNSLHKAISTHVPLNNEKKKLTIISVLENDELNGSRFDDECGFWESFFNPGWKDSTNGVESLFEEENILKHDALPEHYSLNKHIQIPIIDKGATPGSEKSQAYVDDKTQQALIAMKDAYDNGEMVYVHCRLGRGRSAMIIALYKIIHEDMSIDQAIANIKKQRTQTGVNAKQRAYIEKYIKTYHPELINNIIPDHTTPLSLITKLQNHIFFADVIQTKRDEAINSVKNFLINKCLEGPWFKGNVTAQSILYLLKEHNYTMLHFTKNQQHAIGNSKFLSLVCNSVIKTATSYASTLASINSTDSEICLIPYEETLSSELNTRTAPSSELSSSSKGTRTNDISHQIGHLGPFCAI